MTGRPSTIDLQDVLAKLRHGFANGKTDIEILDTLPFTRWDTLHSYLSRNGISLVKLRKEHGSR